MDALKYFIYRVRLKAVLEFKRLTRRGIASMLNPFKCEEDSAHANQTCANNLYTQRVRNNKRMEALSALGGN